MADYKTKEIPLTGKLQLNGDGTVVGTNFVELKNVRYGEKHLENVLGMTKVNSSSLADDVDAAFFFQKDVPTVENNLIIHKGTTLLSQNVVPPTTGNFSTTLFTDSAGAGDPRFSSAPGGKMVYCNGIDTAIWGGLEIKPNGFIHMGEYNPRTANTGYKLNYLDQISNDLQDDANVATIHSETSAIDPYTSLLLHFDQNFDDSSTSGLVATNNNVTAITAGVGRGGYCAYFNGSNANLAYADNTAFDLSAGIFTIDFWVKVAGTTAFGPAEDFIYHQETVADATSYISITGNQGASYYGSPQYVRFKLVSGGSTLVEMWGAVSKTTWSHVAIVCDGTIYYMFIDGHMVAARLASAGLPANYDGDIHIGNRTGNTDYAAMYLDEFTIAKGKAKWTANFIPTSYNRGSHTTVSTIYVGSTTKIDGLNLYVKTANTTSGTARCAYWNGATWIDVGTITGVGGIPLGSTGLNTWTFASTVATAKLKSIDDTLLYWYKVEIFDCDTSTVVYKATISAPMQQITDIWDGAYRTIGSFQHYQGTALKYNDYTSNVSSEFFDSNNAGTYAKLGGFTFSSDSIYVGSFERLSGIKFTFAGGFSNTVACTMSISYWNGEGWIPAIGLNDGTANSDISFNKTGTITWNVPDYNTEFKQVLAGFPFIRPRSDARRISETDIREQSTIFGRTLYPTPTTAVSPVNPSSTLELYYYKITFTGNGTTTAFPTESTTVGVRPFNATLIPAQNNIMGYKFAIEHGQRLWLCNLVGGEASVALASSLETSQVFNGNDSFRQYFGNDKGLVGAVSLYSRVATVINNTALFFKQSETWALDVGVNGQIQPRLVSGAIGCTAPYTIDSADVEVTQGTWKRIAVWQSQAGIMFSDGTSPICISNDIEDLFDPSDSDYYGSAVLSTCHGFIDPQRNEYHWVIPGETEYVFSFADKKWFEIDRTAATRLRGGIAVYDSYGASYPYGFGTNYVWRLENGYTFDGDDIVCSLQFGDIAIDEGSIFKKTTLKSTKLIAVALSSASNTIALTHYGDGATASTAFKVISPLNSGKRLIGKIVPNSTGSHIFHTFKFVFNVNATNQGFEPIFFGVNYSNDGKDL